MLLQTNSYIVPKDRRSEHARLLRKFRQTLHRLGCDQFEVYEQVGANWASGEATGRFVQIMRFRDRAHQQQVQSQEKQDSAAQQVIQEFCALINFPYQQQQGLFAIGFYTSALPVAPARTAPRPTPTGQTQPTVRPPDKRDEPPSAASSVASSESFELPPTANPEDQGASLLNFAALAPAPPEESTPLRLTSDTDAFVESDISAPDAADSDALENSANGEHTGSFSETSDRDGILGEMTGEDARKNKAEG